MKLAALIFATSLSLAGEAWAFPENVRHGYVNCTSCHVSPAGGGLLTAYGRGTSGELMSTWAFEGEGEPFHGKLVLPERVNLGGDYRWLQRYLNTSTIEEGQQFGMQAELAASVTVGPDTKPTTFMMTAGSRGGPEQVEDRGHFVSREHYVLHSPRENLNLRSGRFRVAYGLNQPNHIALVRRGLGFDQDTEPYGIEMSYLADEWDVFVTNFWGRPEEPSIDRGFAISASRAFQEKHKIGLSAYRGENGLAERQLLGVFGVLGWTHSFYHLFELDVQWRESLTSGVHQKGAASLNKLGYEFHKGVHGLLVHQLSYLNEDLVTSRRDNYGVGFQFLPRPHFEISGEYLWERNLAVGDERYETAWFILHYYL